MKIISPSLPPSKQQKPVEQLHLSLPPSVQQNPKHGKWPSSLSVTSTIQTKSNDVEPTNSAFDTNEGKNAYEQEDKKSLC